MKKRRHRKVVGTLDLYFLTVTLYRPTKSPVAAIKAKAKKMAKKVRSRRLVPQPA